MIRFSGLSSGIRETITRNTTSSALIATTKTSRSRMMASMSESVSIPGSCGLNPATARSLRSARPNKAGCVRFLFAPSVQGSTKGRQAHPAREAEVNDAKPDLPAAIERWHDIARTGDASRLDGLLAPDVIFESPVVHTPQRGKEITAEYLGA